MKLLIVDDHPLVRDGLRAVLAATFVDCEITESDTLEDALSAAEAEADLDLVLLDLHLPGQQGFSGLDSLRRSHPTLPVVMVSAECDRRLCDEALRRGAAGFIPKSLPRQEFVAGLKLVLEGGAFIPAHLPEGEDDAEAREIESRVSKLTPQQRAVLGLVVAGRLNKEIAYALSISETTVKAHVSAILQKLRVFSRTQAVILANRIGFSADASTRGGAPPVVRAAAC